ncbi:T9SS C-terminal target domain-containing protein [bacterium]|nr:MAG: T9SS C-terminal target domain-containing protein [bacterium]
MKRIWISLVVTFVIATVSIPEGVAQVQSGGPEIAAPTWSYIWYDSVTQHSNFRCLAVKAGTIFGGTDSKYLQKSTDLGKTWSQKDYRNGLNIPFGTVDALLVLPSGEILLGAGSIYKSTDNGENWRRVATGYAGGGFTFLRTRSGVLFSGSGGIGAGIYKSTDNGETWILAADSVFSTTSYLTGFTETRSGVLLAVTQSALKAEGIFRSTDGGKTWIHSNAGLTETNFVSVSSDPQSFPEKIYAMGYSNGAFFSEDGGLNWFPIAELTEKKGGTVFGTSQGFFFGFEVWNREPVYQLLSSAYRPMGFPLGYMVMSGCQYDDRHILFGTHNGLWLATYPPVTAVEKDVPVLFSLSQNYPNPFNPSTTIQFSLPTRTNVDLKIYNALGQMVETLVSGGLNAGVHQYVWNPSTSSGQALPSGIYFYQLKAGTFTETKRMLLVK